MEAVTQSAKENNLTNFMKIYWIFTSAGIGS